MNFNFLEMTLYKSVTFSDFNTSLLFLALGFDLQIRIVTWNS